MPSSASSPPEPSDDNPGLPYAQMIAQRRKLRLGIATLETQKGQVRAHLDALRHRERATAWVPGPMTTFLARLRRRDRARSHTVDVAAKAAELEEQLDRLDAQQHQLRLDEQRLTARIAAIRGDRWGRHARYGIMPPQRSC